MSEMRIRVVTMNKVSKEKRSKIRKNVERNRRNIKLLIKKGYKIIRLWECQLLSAFLRDVVAQL